MPKPLGPGEGHLKEWRDLEGSSVIDVLVTELYRLSDPSSTMPTSHEVVVTPEQFRFLSQLQVTPGWYDQALLTRWDELYGHLRPIPRDRSQWRVRVAKMGETLPPYEQVRAFHTEVPPKYGLTSIPPADGRTGGMVTHDLRNGQLPPWERLPLPGTKVEEVHRHHATDGQSWIDNISVNCLYLRVCPACSATVWDSDAHQANHEKWHARLNFLLPQMRERGT